MARRSSIHDLERDIDALAAIAQARPLTDAESERLQRLHHEHQMWRSRLVRQIRNCRAKLARLEGNIVPRLKVGEIKRDTIVQERTAMLTHRRKHAAGIDEQVRRGRMTEEEAALCKRCVATFADDIAIGLHIEGDDPPGVREAIKAHVKQRSGDRIGD